MSAADEISFENRHPTHGADRFFIERWSPRAYSSEPIDEPTLTTLMDAARWSPSCFNDQPWRFYTSTPQTRDAYLGLLLEGNQVWAATAPVIGFLCAQKRFSATGEPNGYNAFDAGAAWMAMTMQARLLGLYTHGMGGIDKAAVADYLGIDTDTEEVLMGFTIGRRGDPSQLPEKVRQNEEPTSRHALETIWTHGKP